MSSYFRKLMGPSFIECKRDGVQIGEQWWVNTSDSADTGTVPSVGDPYDETHPECILVSFKRSQYQNSQCELLTCYYSNEEELDPEFSVPLPKAKLTIGGEILSLSKDFKAKWSSDSAAVNQLLQMLIPSCTCEAWEANSDWESAQDLIFSRVGKISSKDPQWLCVAAQPFPADSVVGSVYDGESLHHIRVKYQFAYRGNSLGWAALFRESTGAWETTDTPLYETVDANDDFDYLVPWLR